MKDKELIQASFRSPFSLMRRLSDEMERVFDDVGLRRSLAFANIGERAWDWVPALEMFQRDNRLCIRAELPGLTKDDVKIEFADDLLTIQGERKQEKEEKKGGFIRSERCYGRFFRQIALPEGVSADTAKATFHNGMLEIEMPLAVRKPESVKRLTIEEPAKDKEKELVGA